MPKALAIVLLAIAAVAHLLGAAAPAFAQDGAARLGSAATLPEFIGSCAGVDNLDKLLANVRKRGWEPVDPADHAFAARRIADFETSMAANAGGQRPLVAVFRRSIGGNELVLIVEDLLLPNSRVVPRISYCTIYDRADAPSYDSLVAAFGRQRSDYDDTLPANPVVDSAGGASWYDEFGLPGASVTGVSTWRDEQTGRYVVYQTSKHYFVTPKGVMPNIPPPIVRIPGKVPPDSEPAPEIRSPN